MTPKEKADMDQGMALMVDTLPALWRRMYVNLLSEGFGAAEAMDLLKTFITATYRIVK